MEIQLKSLISEHKREISIVLSILLGTTLVIGALAYFTGPSGRSLRSPKVPEEFFAARARAGDIADEIVGLTADAREGLNTISAADAAGEYREALDLVLSETERTKTIKEAAFNLSEELKTMAMNLDDVRPKEALDIGSQAVVAGIELAQHIVTYNDYSEDLLRALQSRFEAGDSQNKREKIDRVIKRMNKEVDSINTLNETYKELIREFDTLTA